MAQQVQWEYKVFTPQHQDMEKQFNKLGANRWELVSATCAGPDWVITMYFKRQIVK